MANKIRSVIHEKIGESKLCIIIIDEVSLSKKEQMAIILKFVDKVGFVREHFFDLVHFLIPPH